MAENVADFAARLGLDISEKEWQRGFAWTQKMGQRLHQMRTEAGDAAARGIDVSKAMGLIGITAPKAATASFNWAGALTTVAKAAAAAGAAIGGAAAALAYMVHGTLESFGRVDDLRQMTGLTNEEIQEFGYVAEHEGSSLEAFAGGVKKLFLALKHGGEDSEEAVKALQSVGIAGQRVQDIISGKEPLSESLLDIATAFQSMEDGPKKSALAMALFGKTGGELIPFLNQGRNGVQALRDRARELGLVIEEDTVAAGANLGDQLTDITKVVGGLKNQLIAALIPSIRQGADAVMLWIRGNRELLQQKVRDFAEAIVAGVQKLVAAVEWLYANRELLTKPLSVLIESVEGAAKIIQFLVETINSIKSAVAPVLEWLADKFGFVADAVNKVADGINRITGGGGDGEDGGKKGWGSKARDAVVDTALGPVWNAVRGKNPLKSGIFNLLADETGAPKGNLDSIDWTAGLGAATPTLPSSSTSNVTNAPVFDVTTQIEVHATPGMSAADVADAVTTQFDEMWDAKLRQAKGGG
jgi:hypothetical protein